MELSSLCTLSLDCGKETVYNIFQMPVLYWGKVRDFGGQGRMVMAAYFAEKQVVGADLQRRMKKWRSFCVRNPNLVPYETIVRATSGEPEAVDEVLRHYSKRIRLASLENGHVNKDTEDNIKRRLIAALFQFRFDEQEV